jgi:hypothetical protein
VQDLRPKAVALFEPRSLESPVVGHQHFVGGGGHGARIGEGDAEQVRLALARGVEAAFLAGRPLIEAAHRRAVIQILDRAIDAVAAEVHEPAAALEDPRLYLPVHLDRPVFGMHAQD